MKKVCFVSLLLIFFLLSLLLAQEDFSALKKKLAKELDAKDYKLAAETVREIGKINSKDAASFILEVTFKVESPEIFTAAKEALSTITDSDAIQFICKTAKKAPSYQVRAMLAEVLAKLPGDEPLNTLIALLEDKDHNVLREAVRGIREKGNKKAVEPLIELLGRLEDGKGLIWIEVREALTALTGMDFDTSTKWREQWAARKEEEKAKGPESPETAKIDSTGAGPKTSIEEEIKKAPRFFGKEILSKRIVFVVDVSGSMIMKDRDTGGGEAGKKDPSGSGEYKDIPEDRMRIKRAQAECKKAIAAMDPKTKFNVIAFADYVRPWQQKKLVLATPDNKNSAIKFVEGFRANGGTYTDDAMKEAFANEEADTIYLLSDGAPERYPSAAGQENPQNEPLIGQILDWVRNANKVRKVKIFTFGFDGEGVWDPNQGQKPPYHLKAQRFIDFMKKLAEENGGEYKSIR